MPEGWKRCRRAVRLDVFAGPDGWRAAAGHLSEIDEGASAPWRPGPLGRRRAQQAIDAAFRSSEAGAWASASHVHGRHEQGRCG